MAGRRGRGRRLVLAMAVTIAGVDGAVVAVRARPLAPASKPVQGVQEPVAPGPTPGPPLQNGPEPAPMAGVAVPIPPARSAQTPGAVGEIRLGLSDAGRPTVASGRTLSPARSLPTTVRYPALGPAGPAATDGAPPAAGPWPLVIFDHGYAVTGDTYAHLLHAWAAAGFVVVAPDFPLQTAGGPLDENDLINEPADNRFVIDALRRLSASPTGLLSGLIDPARVAVTGHSDGAQAALATAFGSPAGPVGPVIAISCAPSAGIPHPDSRRPLLVIQGTADEINPPGNAGAAYDQAGRPRYFLSLTGAGHLAPVVEDNRWRPVVEAVALDFLERHLGGPSTPGGMEAHGGQVGISQLTAQP